jgi:hypothetical protein
MIYNIKGYFILQAIVILTFILAFLVLAFGCDSAAGTIDYRPLYNEQVAINSSLRSQNTILQVQNDSLLVKINHLNDLVIGLNKTIQAIYLEATIKIDSLKNVVANQDSIRDSETIIMLQSIENGLENLSDQGLNYLIEMRKK